MRTSRTKKPRKTITERVEDVLARAMHDYAYYRVTNLGCWAHFPREHAAFLQARRSILRILREARRG